MTASWKSMLSLLLVALCPVEAWFRDCFVLLEEPLQSPPFNDADIGKMLQYFRANFNINGTGAITASPGPTPALGPNQWGYAYHWMRDGALSIKALQRLARQDGLMIDKKDLDTVLEAYLAWIRRTHDKIGGDAAFSEPKWVINSGLPYTGQWCHPQTDGPALRASSLMMTAETMPERKRDIWELAKLDLNWLATGDDEKGTNVERLGCDLWEETRDSNFLWNRVVMRTALLDGSDFALQMGEQDLALTYRQAAETYIGNPWETHVEHSFWSSFAAECLTNADSPVGSTCAAYDKALDGAVILSFIHGRSARDLNGSMAAFPQPTSKLAAQTVKAYNKAFCDLYDVNKEDTKAGVPGVLYGRYRLDVYGSGRGNPWVLITASLASLFYQAAQLVGEGKKLSSEELQAWRSAFGERPWGSFSGSVESFIAAGDSVLFRLKHHIHQEDDMHLFEQIDRESGRQYNARDLTWSYAEVLSALLERSIALEGLAKSAWTMAI